MDSLPRLVVTAASQATRNGLAPDEIQVFRSVIADYELRVLNDYPRADSSDVAAWMLVAAVDAAIAGRRELAAYHLAWLTATTTTAKGGRPR